MTRLILGCISEAPEILRARREHAGFFLASQFFTLNLPLFDADGKSSKKKSVPKNDVLCLMVMYLGKKLNKAPSTNPRHGFSLRIQICPKKGISLIILWSGWD